MNIDTWQKGYAELSRQLATLKKENLAMKDELIKLRRTYEDQINNLTFDNMPAVKKITLQTDDGVAGLIIRLNETNAQVLTIAEVQTEQGKSIAAIDAKADSAVSQISLAVQRSEEAEEAATQASAKVDLTADELGASIAQLTATQTAQGKSIAAITQTTNELGAEVNFAVESASAANENVSNGAYLIARVNEDGSNVKIKADKVEIEGVVTFSDLEEEGKTTINGANIETGTISANKIAVGTSGTIDFSNLGSLDFLTESGASGSIRLNENEYGRGEIAISADMYVGISAGRASLTLNESPNYDTEMRVYADNLVMNGKHGLSGTFSLGNGSITVVNGIVVYVENGGGGGGGSDEPITLDAPDVSVNAESASFSIYNPNGRGTICYQLYWYDDYGDQWESDVRSSDDMSVDEYFDDVPSYGGLLVATAWVEYRGYTSPKASANDVFA